MEKTKTRWFAVILGIIFFIVSIFIWLKVITDKYEDIVGEHFASYLDEKFYPENDWQGWFVLGVGLIVFLLTQQISATCDVNSSIMLVRDKNSDILSKLNGIERTIMLSSVDGNQAKAEELRRKIVNGGRPKEENVPTWKKVAQSAQQAPVEQLQTAPAASGNDSLGFCQECGAKRKEGAVFCYSCGNKFN